VRGTNTLTHYTPKTKPFPFQTRAILAAVRARNYAIFFEPRLGKTKVALDWVGILALKGEIRKVLIIAPKIALDVWESEIAKHFPYPAHVETFDEEWDHSGVQFLPPRETSKRVLPSQGRYGDSPEEVQGVSSDSENSRISETSTLRVDPTAVSDPPRESTRMLRDMPKASEASRRSRPHHQEGEGTAVQLLQSGTGVSGGRPKTAQKSDQVSVWLAGRETTFRRTRDSEGALEKQPKQVELERWRPDAVIVDESHEYKRPGGRGAQDLWRLVGRLRKAGRAGRPFPYVLLLTGTPSAKGWRDIFAQFRIMDDSVLGTNAGDFDEDYCVYGEGRRRYTIIRYRNLRRLQRKIDAHSVTCTAEQAGLAGVMTFQLIPYQLPAKIRRQYDELAENFVADFDGALVTAANAGVKRLRLLQVTSGFLTDPKVQLHAEEIKAAQEYLTLLREQGENVVVYGRFTDEVEALGAVTEHCGFRSAIIDGRTRSRDRTLAIRAFQSETRSDVPRALVFQYQAGSRAIELTAAAEVLFGSLPDGWVDFWQCLNRVRGPNQKRPVRISALCASGTVDRSVLYGLRNKEDMHRLLMKDPKRFLAGGYVDVI
jgi:hypothetical protein